MIRKTIIGLAFFGAIFSVVSCTPPAPPQPDQVYCQDLEEIQRGIDETPNIQRPQVKSELLDDVIEMGYNEGCAGYEEQYERED